MEYFVMKSLMHQSFLHYRQNTKDGGGNVTSYPPVAIKGYKVGMTKMVRTAGGDQVISSAHVFVNEVTFPLLTVGDLIQPPGTERTQPILALQDFYGDGGQLIYGIAYLR